MLLFSKGLENRKSLRNRQLAKKVMEEMTMAMKLVVENAEEADEDTGVEVADDEADECELACEEEWRDKSDKQEAACRAICYGSRRRNRRLVMGGLMGDMAMAQGGLMANTER